MDFFQKKHDHPIGYFSKLFTDTLKYWRDFRNLTQKQLAQKLDIPVSTYANWEQGRREPSLYDYYNLMNALDIDANDLFFGIT